MAVQFCSEGCGHILYRGKDGVGGGDGGVRNVFVLKNTMTDIIVARVFLSTGANSDSVHLRCQAPIL